MIFLIYFLLYIISSLRIWDTAKNYTTTLLTIPRKCVKAHTAKIICILFQILLKKLVKLKKMFCWVFKL